MSQKVAYHISGVPRGIFWYIYVNRQKASVLVTPVLSPEYCNASLDREIVASA